MMFKILPGVVGGCLPYSCNMGNILNINSVKILVALPPPRCCCSQAAAAAAATTTAPNWHRSASVTAVAAADKLPHLPPQGGPAQKMCFLNGPNFLSECSKLLY